MPDVCDESSAKYAVYMQMRVMHIQMKVADLQQARPVNGTVLCARCGEEIPEKRLKAVPGTRYCVDCKAIIDNEETERDRAYVRAQERDFW